MCTVKTRTKILIVSLIGIVAFAIDMYVFIGKRHGSENTGDRYGNRASSFGAEDQ